MTSAKNYDLRAIATDCDADDIGFDSRQIDVLDGMYQNLIARGVLQSASYMLAKDGKTFVGKAMGPLTGVESDGDLQVDSIRTIGSITKVFTATAVMQLVEKNKILLRVPASIYLEEMDTPQHRTISVFQLLTHTSGLVADPGSYLESYECGWWSDPRRSLTWMQKVLAGPMRDRPGTAMNYSSGGFCLLAEIVQRVTGKTYEEYVVENIFKPLGMERTFITVPEGLWGEVSTVGDHERARLRRGLGNQEIVPGFTNGGIFSTLADLMKFAQMMLGKGTYNGAKILSRKSVEAMTRNQLDTVPSDNYGEETRAVSQGIAWALCDRNQSITSPGTYKHEGAGASSLYIDPEENFVAVYFVASEDLWNLEAVFGSLPVIWAGIL